LDDDEKGQKIKKDIIKIGSGYKEENVFTIRDLCGSIKSRGTIEDTLPVDYVTSKTNEIVENILLKIKKTISDEYKCTRQPNQNAPLLYSLAEKIIEII
jgi:hypothetical protein